ncbi:MAG TPA: ATP-dependent RNA helicase HrpA [Polyangiaceae bacterium]|jgi:ATP-dependent helicase HrpA|nr:ATP-dependent RNA helicase HrpA [Polyangiaceae bacterium]
MPEAESPLRFPPELPITARVRDIAAAIDENPVVIVAGATGSGKTTQLPKIALAMGRGVRRMIGVTEPRRIAATSVAARVASEIGSPLGTEIGYQVRFDDRTSAQTYVKFMTDGILLAEIHGDGLLQRYDTIIVDEAHERSLTIDFVLGWLKRLLPKRPDLKVVVSSATLDTDRLSHFFGKAPVITVEGRTFPVDVLYEPPADDVDGPESVANAVDNIVSLDPRGDVLVFLPGEREIRDTERELQARALPHTTVQPLYSRLSAAEQARVFAPITGRRVILATNVAETSLTIPGIVYVVDMGVARLSRYDSRSGTTRLQIEGISQASADQRKGRCGRVREGICIRLYDEASYAARPAFTDPEILRTGLAGVILRMKALGLGDVEDFPFLDPPPSRSVTEGYRVLEELGALGPDRELTPLGERLARFPVDPRIGRMILAAEQHGCVADVLVVAAALTVQDPRERPREHQQKADQAHARFSHPRSDFASFLRLWAFARAAERRGSTQLRRACKESFLSFLRIREWMDVHKQLQEAAREIGIPIPAPSAAADSAAADPATADFMKPEAEAAFHTALLTGLPSKIGQWNDEKRIYLGARQTRFSIHPSSVLSRKTPAWVMAYELVETTQLYARTVARIEPEWLLRAAPHLLKRSYADPHWSEKTGRATIKEQATLYGLPVFRDRSVDYANVAPAQARLMFLDHALVRGEYRSPGAFQAHNREILERVARLRDKARRSDMMSDEGALLAVFDRLVPRDVVNGKTFETWRTVAEKENPEVLHLSIGDVLAGESSLKAEDYPDAIALHGVTLDVGYRFDPAAEDDGITLTVPLALVPQIEPGELDWTIPGWHREKIAALLETLPRALRRELGEVRDLAAEIAPLLVPFHGLMIPTLAAAVSRVNAVEVGEDAFAPDRVPSYLRLSCRIVSEGGKTLAMSKDIGALWQQYAPEARAAWKDTAPSPRWTRKGITSWDFGDLEPFVVRRVSGIEVRSYPAIVDRGASVDLALLESKAAADAATRAGVQRLFAIATRHVVAVCGPRLPPGFARPSGAPLARSDSDAFAAMAVARVVEDAFGLGEGPSPRTKREFEDRLAIGTPRIAASFRRVSELLARVASDLDATLQALRSAAKHPGAKIAIAEIRAQLDALFPADLLSWIPLARLEHFPRYLRAAQARLGRAIADPRKDSEKMARVAPLWAAFSAKQATARDREMALALRWSFEELRVAVFAPELKTPKPVSPAQMASEIAALR